MFFVASSVRIKKARREIREDLGWENKGRRGVGK